MAAPHFTDQDFEDKVLKSDKPVLVDFYADWCGPCQLAAPIIDQMSDEYAEKAVIGKLNVDDNNAVAAKYAVMSIPTVILFKDGQEVERKVGYGGRTGYETLLNKVLS
jgi:thioredoxin 1